MDDEIIATQSQGVVMTTQEFVSQFLALNLKHGYTIEQWFDWLLDDCLASLGRRIPEKDIPPETCREALYAVSGDYAKAVIAHPFNDILGVLYQEISNNYNRKGMGQYFTPFPVAEMMANMQFSLDELKVVAQQRGEVSILEPTCGSGVMLLAWMSIVQAEAPELIRYLSLTAIDLDRICTKMCAVQIMAHVLIHQCDIKGLQVIHGDSLRCEVKQVIVNYENPAFVSDDVRILDTSESLDDKPSVVVAYQCEEESPITVADDGQFGFDF
ncbi:N-6 DNA methylase [Zooshikella ganghwensis]|uniref:site-specific DNA-methyltransferase (adenine-specific) n=1 Tax=Zooshikella ganghwensis TaxID=202772 RepID=A0A4P9VE60_9GAMM|nr:N-6 DNA methylase [Zooshikella ganghwensis]RDH41348.1 hypothetical protein B9G39_29195 [Zooshikella ganghwensis]